MNVSSLLDQSFSNGGGLVVDEQILGEGFFDLSTGIAGEFMQKFVNYHQRLAIVVPDLSVYSKNFQELAQEHRSHPLIRFFPVQSEAEQWLAADD